MSKQLLDSLITDIQTGNLTSVEDKISGLTEEELDALFGETVSFKALGTASSDKFVIGSVSNLREKYLKKLITTTFVGFLFQMKDEYTVDENDLVEPLRKEDFEEEVAGSKLPENFNENILFTEELSKVFKSKFPESKTTAFKDMETELSEDDLILVSTNVKERYETLTKVEKVFNAAKYDEALTATIDKQSDSEREVISRFLNGLFKHNADKDSQEGSQLVEDDPERASIEEMKGTNPVTDAVYENIPSNDTHCRFNTYYDINYEQMRDATQNIYNVKPDLEHAMIVYDIVDTQSAVDSFIEKYGATAKYDILTFPLNKWTLMGPFKQNRDRVDYYNKHNSIIKSMLEQQEKDAALGEELMKKRVKSKKVRSEKVFGKDSDNFNEYKKLSPSELESKYNAKIEEIGDDKLKMIREVHVDSETGERLELDEDGVPMNALEIPITNINAKTGETSQTRIFSRSES